MDRYIHLPIVMLPSPAQLHNLTVELHLACLQNDPDRVTQLMGLGAGRDDLNESGASALEVAEQLNRVEIVKRLMADVDVEKAGMLELLYAIRRGQSTVVQALMEMGVKQQLHDGMVFRGIFLMACAISNAFVVNALVQHGPSINVVAFEEISVYIAQLTGNHVVAEFIHQIGGEQRRRALRANVVSSLCPPSFQSPTYTDWRTGLPLRCPANRSSSECLMNSSKRPRFRVVEKRRTRRGARMNTGEGGDLAGDHGSISMDLCRC